MPARPPEVTTADLSSADSTTELFRSALGPVNAKYYLSRFARFDAADKASASWNWAAAFGTLSWLAFRQLWLAVLGYAGAVVAAILLVFGIGRLVFQFSEGVELGLVMGFAIAAFAVPGLYGNALLYAACRKKMTAALAHNTTVPEACTMLAKRAPTLLRSLLLALVSAAVVGAAVAAYFELPHPGTLPYNLLKTAEPKADAAPATSATTGTGTASAGAPGVDTADETTPAPGGVASTSTTPTTTATTTSATPPALTPAPAPDTPTVPAALSPTVAPAAEVAPAKSQEVKPKNAKAKEAKAPPAKAKPAAEKTAASPKTQAQQKVRFYVNVGLFADSNNALNAYAKLTDAGLPALKQEFNTSKGKRTRVRVGPFDNESEAQTAIEKVRVLGLDAIILRPETPPEKP